LRERFFVYGLDFRELRMGLLKINGKEEIFPDNKIPATIAELLRQLGVDSTTVVAELEGQIVERAKFSTTNLRDGQNIELVRFVPGG
jgi:thiamine biosynthesis protein ThiS